MSTSRISPATSCRPRIHRAARGCTSSVQDRDGRTIFESGALNPDGSIVGNDNDADPHRYEPHYREITSPEQVEIFEPILGDAHGNVTTGLLSAVGYLKDNRLLPSGFDKASADAGHRRSRQCAR